MKRLTAFLMSFLLCIPMLSAVADASDESAPPRVLPALRSWTGSAGVFPVGESTVISDGTNTGVGEKAARFFREMCGKNLTVTPSRVDKSAIRFELVKKLPSEIRHAEEGYLLTVTPAAAVVKAKTYVGLLYGAVTLVQMCYADGQGESIQCGSAADYP
ncbi:MAG: glycoside hydrolase family 20 zincin-like fold domain-containing protein, partial [Clostridia bacterium]|nr:glycoside hydrolase family 20 zincin-like fold domain-containing protein [Clostridia bacterium]